MALITAHYTSLLSNEKDNDASLENRGYSKEQIKLALKNKPKILIKTMGMIYTKPLVKFQYPLMGYLIFLLENYEKGNMPYPGSASEQPAQVIEILTLLQAIKLDFQRAQQNKRS